MSACHDLKLFWPSHFSSPRIKQPCYLIGWYTGENTVCIAASIADISFTQVRALLDNFCKGPYSEYTNIDRVCKTPPAILGVLTAHPHRPSEPGVPERFLTLTLNNAYVPIPISMTTHTGRAIPIKSYEVIFYEQPNPKRLQFLALDPLDLDISPAAPVPEDNPRHRQAMNHLAQAVQYSHRLLPNDTAQPHDLAHVLVQINSSYYLEKGLRKLVRPNRWESFKSFWLRFLVKGPVQSFFIHGLQRLVLGPTLCLLFVFYCLAQLTLQILNTRLPQFPFNGVAIKDLSTAGQQIDLRLQQLYFWPRQYSMLHKRNWANTAETRAYYISFYNSMWLVANDIILGVAIGSFLTTNRYIVSFLLHKILHEYTVQSLRSMMLWFLESPAGLKLNQELGHFLSELFLWLIRLWTGTMQAIKPLTPQIIHVIGLSGIFGVSMTVSLLSDFLAFMTLHVYCFYRVAARIFNWQLVILYSLFNLFRGKKRNLLRHRIDACDYDLDQLLLGTCLFTLLTFLFPTVLVYYLTFALSRVAVIALQAILEALLAFLNHFPLFAIMLRIKDPDRLPGGLKFEPFDHQTFLVRHHRVYQSLARIWHDLTRSKKHASRTHHYHAKTKRKSVQFKLHDHEVSSHRGAYLSMWNMPIPFSAIFFQYVALWKRLSAHYFSAYYFKSFLYGEPIKPIPRLQYPMLPTQRPELATVWNLLVSTLWDIPPPTDTPPT